MPIAAPTSIGQRIEVLRAQINEPTKAVRKQLPSLYWGILYLLFTPILRLMSVENSMKIFSSTP